MTEDRVTYITIRVPWDPETEDHPAGWGWETLLNRVESVNVVSFEDYDEQPQDKG